MCVAFGTMLAMASKEFSQNDSTMQGELPARDHAQHPDEEGRGGGEGGGGQRGGGEQRGGRAIPQGVEGGRGGDGEGGAEAEERGTVEIAYKVSIFTRKSI